MEIFNVIWHALLAFAVLFIISKILGKKQVAQLEFIDYVVGISIGSIAAEMSFDSQIPFYHYIIAMVVFGSFDLAITLLSRKGIIFKKFFKGKPIILIEDGKLNYKNLLKSKLDINELMAQCRVNGYFYINQIAYCIFENSGKFSILPKSDYKEVQSSDLDLPPKEIQLQIEVVIDGKIIKSELNKINKDNEWLFKKLNIKHKKELKSIILAIYDSEKKLLDVYKKQ